MTIESSLERIAAALEVLSRQSVPAADAEPVKRGPGRPPKNPPATPPPPAPPTPKPEPEAEAEVVEPETEDGFLDDEAPTPKEITIEEVRRALIDYQNRCGKAQLAQKLLKDIGGCETLQALKRTPDKWRAVYDAARKA